MIPHHKALELFRAFAGNADEADAKAGSPFTGRTGSPDDLSGTLNQPPSVGDAEEEAESRSRIESVVPAEQHSGSRDVDGLIEGSLGLVRDLDLEVNQHSKRDPRCDFEKICDGLVKTTLRPVETDGAIDTEVHHSARIFDVVGFGKEDEGGLPAPGTIPAEGVDEVVEIEFSQRITHQDEFEGCAEDEIENHR